MSLSPELRNLAREFAREITDGQRGSEHDYDRKLGINEMAVKSWILRVLCANSSHEAQRICHLASTISNIANRRLSDEGFLRHAVNQMPSIMVIHKVVEEVLESTPAMSVTAPSGEPDLNAIRDFLAAQKDTPPDIRAAINKHFWQLVDTAPSGAQPRGEALRTFAQRITDRIAMDEETRFFDANVLNRIHYLIEKELRAAPVSLPSATATEEQLLTLARELFPELCTGLSDDTAEFMRKLAIIRSHAPHRPDGEEELSDALRELEEWRTGKRRIYSAPELTEEQKNTPSPVPVIPWRDYGKPRQG